MARITIIPSDTTVYVGNDWIQGLDMTGVPENIHALQWNWNNSGVGEIEYNDGSQNEIISELPSWATVCQERFTTRLAEIKAEEEAAAAAEAARIAEEERLAAEAQALIDAAIAASEEVVE